MAPLLWCILYSVLIYLNIKNAWDSAKGNNAARFLNTPFWFVLCIGAAMCGAYALAIEAITWLA